ncbi:prolyl-tRNA synthetase associated domain-containing protein [Kordiimonas sp. SCSIO 12610]|uniref:prolyl-tRNA synthetase associated domain-containing protein n=1 Tax=Kordiimonas sp. SCSIO 12610 TaxID=2829597 RepID=UPI00210ED376|nr:prolyl-tRNA synthetase associated domain-containing protein [Kordiimonas sp. SCSIO 12610]UTW55424.1 prolyl-tRNA synthetase associated domain-containing protein [Kordiimonas sp. SCSIO 12610]
MPYPASESDLMEFLKKLEIQTETVSHPPVHTVEDAQSLRGEIQGGHCKCLFIRDKKKRRALIVMDENKQADLKAVAQILGLGRISFGSSNSMMDMLGVKPGSVTPFGLINAMDRYPDIIIALDQGMLENEYLNYHPLHNAATTTIRSDDLLKFIAATGYRPQIIEI